MTLKTVLTGDRPTGKLHLGHYVGSLQNRVSLQNRDDIARRFYMVADVQALTDNYDNPAKVRDNVLQVVLDNMAVGVDPQKTTFFIQSMIPEIAELTVLFMNLVTVNRLLENPTVKTEIAEKGWNAGKLARAFGAEELGDDTNRPGVPAGFLCYPVSQAADILFAGATLIPVGEDQRPMIEQTNEIANAFNRIYNTELFQHVDIMLGDTPRLVGIDGNAKMSKSLGNVIYLSSSRDEIVRQVRSAYTCPSKVRVTDTVSDAELVGNVVFQYLDIFDPNPAEIAEMKAQYQRGEIGDMPGKDRLIEVLDALLTPIRDRRNQLAQDPGAIMQLLHNGIAQTRAIASETMQSVRQAMQIDYFNSTDSLFRN